MQHRSNVSPVPLPVECSDDAITVTYLDGRRVRYSGPFSPRESTVAANQSFAVQALVLDNESGEGVMIYVNDYDTSDAILESTGVGRILIPDGEREVIFPGITASRSREMIEISVTGDPGSVEIYVFIENDRGESHTKLLWTK